MTFFFFFFFLLQNCRKSCSNWKLWSIQHQLSIRIKILFLLLPFLLLNKSFFETPTCGDFELIAGLQRNRRTLSNQLHGTARKELAAAQNVHPGPLAVFNTSRPAQVKSETKEPGGDLESGREKALFSLVSMKVRSLIASFRATGVLMVAPHPGL